MSIERVIRPKGAAGSVAIALSVQLSSAGCTDAKREVDDIYDISYIERQSFKSC